VEEWQPLATSLSRYLPGASWFFSASPPPLDLLMCSPGFLNISAIFEPSRACGLPRVLFLNPPQFLVLLTVSSVPVWHLVVEASTSPNQFESPYALRPVLVLGCSTIPQASSGSNSTLQTPYSIFPPRLYPPDSFFFFPSCFLFRLPTISLGPMNTVQVFPVR